MLYFLLKLKPSSTLWGSWAWKAFTELLIREGRGCRNKEGAAQKVQPWGRVLVLLQGIYITISLSSLQN